MASEPEQGVPRLFVGGLVPAIGNDALRTLVERYGTVRAVDRHTRFAHVGLVPRDEGALDRCVAALNKSAWRGAKLRVERASEHFATRLRREWDEEKEATRARAEEGRKEPVVVERCEALQAKWKGKKRAFEDAEGGPVCEDAQIMELFGDDDTVLIGNTPGLEYRVLDDSSESGAGSGAGSEGEVESDGEDDVSSVVASEDDVAEDVADAVPKSTAAPHNEPVAKEPSAESVAATASVARTAVPKPRVEKPQPSVLSTLALFGVEKDAAPAVRPEPKAEPEKPGPRAAKRPRVDMGMAAYDADALAAEADPARLDFDRERRVARTVLAAMFPGEVCAAGPGEVPEKVELDRIARVHRRPGAFRELLRKAPELGENRNGVKKHVPIKSAIKRFAKYAEKSSGRLKRREGVEAGPRKVAEVPTRRPGLFRTFL